jgi:hypothetical protein
MSPSVSAFNSRTTTTTTRSSTSTTAKSSYTPGSGAPVQVKGYYRKDGTYVRPHTRSAPKRRN